VPKLPRITGKEIVSALKRAGFTLSHTRGSHHYLWHEANKHMVTVPVHTGEIIKPGTLQSILKQAGLTVEEFIKLL
jgi:predicted RNA binding protein YcfA (HicA-like mRNA interferase family)